MKRHTFCGTLDYLAPEVIDPNMTTDENKDSTRSDIWGLGILLYEFVTGSAPFEGADTVSTYKKIRMDKVYFPSYLSEECKDLICKMLKKHPVDRISLDEVAMHEFCVQSVKDGGKLCMEKYGGMVGGMGIQGMESSGGSV